MTGVPCIEIQSISKTYKASQESSLTDVSLTVGHGDIFGLLGPNGAGKTTLVSILCGIMPPSSGHVSYYLNTRRIPDAERKSVIGLVPQEYAFYQELTPRQNLDYFGAMNNMPAKKLKLRREELIDVLGLAKSADRRVETFSGGMKRRVNLAIGIIHSPGILFLDEPTVGVDVQSKNAIINYLKELNRLGTTIVYTSHHMSEAEEFCSHIALMDNGSLIMEGVLSELKELNQVADLQSLFLKLTGAAYRD